MSWYSRLRYAFSSRQVDSDIAEELQTHIDALAESLQGNGLSEREALRQARLRFGNLTRTGEQTREYKVGAFAESVLHDLRYALRSMKKAPGFYTTAVLSLGLAIGAVTAIYSILAAAVLRPLPVRNPEQLVALDARSPSDTQWRSEAGTFSYTLYQSLREAAGRSADLQIFSPAQPAELEGTTARVTSSVIQQYVSGGALPMLGVKSTLGRLLNASDDQLPRGLDVAVISFDFWTRHYNRNPQALGQKLRVGQHAYQIVGVTESGFFGIEPGKFVDVWVPSTTWDDRKAFTSRNYYWLQILGRLDGTTREELAGRLQPALTRNNAERLRTMPPHVPSHFREIVRTERISALHGETGTSLFRRQYRQPVWIVLAVSVSLMFIACANIASLLLARGTARSAEMAMRVSLGASRTRLLRQMLTESFMLAVAAGALGWLLARWFAPALVSLLSTQSDPIRFALYLDTRALLFATLASTAAALLFGTLPAWRSARVTPAAALRSSSGQAGKLRLGRWIVSGQVAGAFCLVAIGGAFSFTLWHLLARDKGFDEHAVAVFEIGGSRMDKDAPDLFEQSRQLLARVRAYGEIRAAGAALYPIYQHMGWSEAIRVPGKPALDREEILYPVSPGYFSAMQTRVLAGRDLNEHDFEVSQPIATVVNVELARRYFGREAPIGDFFERRENEKIIRHQVVGVVENAFYFGNREGVEPIAYPALQARGVPSYTLYVRSAAPLARLSRIVEDDALALGTHVRRVTPLAVLVGNSVLREKLLAGLGTTFGFISLLLAAIGVFGLLNYSVARRTKELGIRAALGATRSNLVSLVARDLATTMSIGVLIGLAIALSLMPLLRSLLFGVETFDPSVMLTAAACFLLAAFVAGGLPARRAASIDPNSALREE